MKRNIVILCKGTPNGEELTLRDLFISRGDSARVVSATLVIDRRERESCDIAYSFHKDLLVGYDVNELVMPEGVEKASSGYTIQRKGRWCYIIDPDGNKVNQKGLSFEDATKLMGEL